MIASLTSSLRATARPAFGAGAAVLPGFQQARSLNVHEYVGIEILSQHGVATPKAETATSAKQAEDIFIKAIIVPIGVFGGAVGVLKSCQYVCDEQLVV